MFSVGSIEFYFLLTVPLILFDVIARITKAVKVLLSVTSPQCHYLSFSIFQEKLLNLNVFVFVFSFLTKSPKWWIKTFNYNFQNVSTTAH